MHFPAAARAGFSAALGGLFPGHRGIPLGPVAPRKCGVGVPTCTSAMRDGHQNGAEPELLAPVLDIRCSRGWPWLTLSVN